MASGKWERVGKGGKPANKCTGQQKSHKNTKDSDKPLDGSQLELTGMIILIVSCSRLLLTPYSIKFCEILTVKILTVIF